MNANRELLERAHAAFNARDLEAALATMDADAVWLNGMEGGYVHGHSGVRDYWLRQRSLIDPHVEPVRFAADSNARSAVQVRQVVRSLADDILQEQTVQHV